MPKFPTKEADIIALANAMILGYFAHAADFPSSTWWWLAPKRSAYISAKNAQTDALAVAQFATDEKDAKLTALVEKMKAELKKSEVDVTDIPEKLEYIGWGPKANPQLTEVPGQPADLRIIAQGRGTILLNFDRPAAGTVRNYIIERREQSVGNAEFGPWHIVGTALETEASLTGQPRGVQLEYRIKAINTGGESPPSNTVAVVL